MEPFCFWSSLFGTSFCFETAFLRTTLLLVKKHLKYFPNKTYPAFQFVIVILNTIFISRNTVESREFIVLRTRNVKKLMLKVTINTYCLLVSSVFCVPIISRGNLFHHQFINMKSIKDNEKSALDNEMK